MKLNTIHNSSYSNYFLESIKTISIETIDNHKVTFECLKKLVQLDFETISKINEISNILHAKIKEIFNISTKKNKTMYLVLGGIGTGKSSLSKKLFSTMSLEYINSDLYKKMFFDSDDINSNGYKNGDILADFKMKMKCENNEDFVYEFCPTNEKKINRVIELKKQYGYSFVTFILWTEKVEINIKRTENRFNNENSDHVSIAKVLSRYKMAFKNLPRMVSHSETVYFIDNTNFFKTIACLEGNELHIYDSTNWFNNNLLNKITL